MPELCIHTLGHSHVFIGGELVNNFETNKVYALLVYLAVESKRPIKRGTLAGLLWSDQPEEKALHSLRQALSGLRKALGEKKEKIPLDKLHTPIILAVKDTLQINPEVDLWLDFHAFEKQLHLAYKHFQVLNGKGKINIRRLKQAVSLYKGSFLDQFFFSGSPLFDEWFTLKRDYIDQRMVEALSLLADYQEKRGELFPAIQTMKRLARLAPWDESAYLKIVRWLAQEGNWSAALSHAEKYIDYIRKDLGVSPSHEIMDLVKQVRKKSLNISYRDRITPESTQSLPLMDSTFVGREAELDLISDLLANPSCRLLTLSGVGGSGKTRLALQAAEEQVGIFSDGVFFVQLSSIQNHRGFFSAIAEAAGFRFFGDRSPRSQLISFFKNKKLLLVLDNIEHLAAEPDEKAELSQFILDILKVSEYLKLILTSRSSLELRSEQVIQVEGLSYPSQNDLKDARASNAVMLFNMTAQRILPSFSLDGELYDVVQICRMLEGLPLAIELSAAWVRVQPCREIVSEIKTDLDYLTTSMQDIPTRHRSLRAVFDHSWRLLSNEEKTALKKLSSFRSGFNLEAAQQAAGVSPVLLASLAKNSLIYRLKPDRYDLHSLIKQYALEKLVEDKDLQRKTDDRFSAYYVNYLSDRATEMKCSGQQTALEELAQERPNWQKAWEWLVKERNAAVAANCTEAIFHFYNIRSLFKEGIEMLQKASTWLEKNQQHTPFLGIVLTFLGALAYRAHEDTLCHTSLERAIRLLEEKQDLYHLAFALIFWSGIKSRRKEHAAAMDAAQRSVELNRQLGDVWGEGYALYMRGLLESRKGLLNESVTSLQGSLTAAKLCGDLRRQIGPLNILGDNACNAGSYDLAMNFFEESLDISKAIQDRYNEALTSLNLGTVFHIKKQFDEAKRLYEVSLEIWLEIGDTAGQATALSNLGELALDAGDYNAALPYFNKGLTLSRQQQDDWAEVSCLNNLVYAYIKLENFQLAETYLQHALVLCAGLSSPQLSSNTLLHHARLKLIDGDRQTAAELIHTILKAEGIQEDIRQKASILCTSEKLDLPDGPPKSVDQLIEALQY
jgi:predicted ATPase/DNA-binding SARP family transcriptional activator